MISEEVRNDLDINIDGIFDEIVVTGQQGTGMTTLLKSWIDFEKGMGKE